MGVLGEGSTFARSLAPPLSYSPPLHPIGIQEKCLFCSHVETKARSLAGFYDLRVSTLHSLELLLSRDIVR